MTDLASRFAVVLEATKKREKGTLGASAVLAGVQGAPEKLTRV
jgi:hypothetical protein